MYAVSRDYEPLTGRPKIIPVEENDVITLNGHWVVFSSLSLAKLHAIDLLKGDVAKIKTQMQNIRNARVEGECAEEKSS